MGDLRALTSFYFASLLAFYSKTGPAGATAVDVFEKYAPTARNAV